MTPDELRAQRWFRSKQRPITAVIERDRAALTSTGASLAVLEVAYADGGAPDRYLRPLVHDREPADGDGAWRALAAAMEAGAELAGSRGRFVGAPSPSTSTGGPPSSAMEERRLRVEQSNTSVVLGERQILKLYRLLEPGDNPDLEVSAFLTEVGFGDTPAVSGSLEYRDETGSRSVAAMLQAFVPSHGDAWTSMLDALAVDPARATEIAATVGDLTRRLHRALGARPEHADFAVHPATGEDVAAWRASAERQLAQAVSAVSGDAHVRLVALAPRFTARFADTFGAAGGEARTTRIHGDYHLGQLLARTDGGYSVIDFEGEPARPIEERRRRASPLRDVAGMLRSLDYAARTAEAGRHTQDFDADGWLADAREAFLAAYGGIDGGDRGLLDAFELEKACYEVRYEANNRPGWLWLPLAAIERLAAAER